MSAIAPPHVPLPEPFDRRGGSVLLRHVSWDGYLTLLREIGDDAVHLTYDDGFLEVEVPSERHEQLKKLIDALVEAALDADGIDFEPRGSTTWNRETPPRGIEADECYYIQNAERIRRRTIDLNVDPPPDLAVEIDVSSSSIDKLTVYAALGIPEVWRVREGGDVEFFQLQSSGVYQASATSAALPRLTPELIRDHVRLLDEMGHAKTVRHFRQAL